MLVLDFRSVFRLPPSKIEDEHEHDNERDIKELRMGGIPLSLPPKSYDRARARLSVRFCLAPSKIEDEHEHDDEHD